MKLLLIFILCSAFIAFKPVKECESIVRRPVRVHAAAAVQTANNQGDAVSSLAVTTSSTTSGNLLVVSFAISTVSGRTVTSVTDNQSSSYTVGSGLGNGGVDTWTVFQAYAVANAGVTSVTITLSGNASIVAIVDEYSGTATSSVSDVRATNSGTGTSTSVSLTPGAADKLIVATLCGVYADVWTAGTNYTLYGLVNYGSVSHLLRSQYRLVGTTSETAPSTFTYTIYGTEGWAEIANSYNLASTATNTGGFFNFFKP